MCEPDVQGGTEGQPRGRFQGEVIRIARWRRGMTQPMLAELSGLSQSTVSRVEVARDFRSHGQQNGVVHPAQVVRRDVFTDGDLGVKLHSFLDQLGQPPVKDASVDLATTSSSSKNTTAPADSSATAFRISSSKNTLSTAD